MHLLTLFIIFMLLNCSLNQQSCLRPFRSTLAMDGDADFLQTRRLKIIKSEEDTAPYIKARIPYANKNHNFDKLDIVLSILSMTNFHEKSGISIQIYPIISETYFYAVIEYKQTTTWTLAEIHYIISSREQIRVGNFLVMNDDFQYPNQQSRTVLVQSPLKIELKNKVINVKVFITGLKSESQLFQLSISSSRIVNNSLQTSIKIYKNNKAIQRLRISYILVEPGYHYAMHQGSLDKNPIPGVTSYNGTKFKQSKAKQNKRFLTQENHGVVENIQELNLPAWEGKRLQMAFTIQKLEIVNIVFLTPIAKDPNILHGAMKQPILQNKCITPEQCKKWNGTVYESVGHDHYYDCILCDQNETYDGCSSCKCMSGYARYQADCVLVEQFCGSKNKTIIQDSCVQLFSVEEYCKMKNQVYDEKLDSCKCKEGMELKMLINGQQYCYQKCQEGMFNIFTSACECPQGTQMKNNKCAPTHLIL